MVNGRILRRNLHFIETKCHAEKMCFPGMAFFIVLILILQQKNDSLDLPFYFTLSFFCCFRNANSLLGKRSTAGCFCLIKPKKSRIFGFFSKRKHCTIVSFVQCNYGCGSRQTILCTTIHFGKKTAWKKEAALCGNKAKRSIDTTEFLRINHINECVKKLVVLL